MAARTHTKVGKGATGSLAVVATATIRDRILDLTLPPGMQLDEAILRDKLGISRTPAREALNRLVTEGLVETRANRGFFVRALDLADTAQFFDAYIVSERSSAHFCRFKNPAFVDDLERIQADHEKAIKRDRFLDVSHCNAQFHVRIAEASENPHLVDFSSRLHNLGRRLAYFVYANEAVDHDFLETQQRHIIEEHHRIIAAIRAGDRERLIKEMGGHTNRFRKRIGHFVTAQGRVEFELSGVEI
ncbi:MAG: GntR family transcriptional regulator [Proteobacteria bacterium]|nr:GntR family transcriptional regulator [Pseudomonadota bacterium]